MFFTFPLLLTGFANATAEEAERFALPGAAAGDNRAESFGVVDKKNASHDARGYI